jgi:hypothetical protein
VRTVFISSIQRDFEAIREAIRRAVESLGLQPLMAETAGAHVESPQRALLDLVAQANVFLLVLGPRYSKPTEDEYDEARRRGLPILVLRQTGEAEPEQEAFAERVSGGWAGGRLRGTFTDASDVALAVVRAITNLREQGTNETLAPAAQQRARELALGAQRGAHGHGAIARIAFVPLASEPLLDVVALDRADLGDNVAALLREQRLVTQSTGIESRVTGAGVTLTKTGGYANAEPVASLEADGSVVVAFEVGGNDNFGSMRVDPERLADGIAASGRFALAAWAALDEREVVQQVAVAVAIPDAGNKVFGASTGSNSIQMGGFGRPSELVVPEPARIVRRAEVASSELSARLVAEVRRVFADAGAIQH